MGNNIASCTTCRAYHHPREPGMAGSCRYSPPVVVAQTDRVTATQYTVTAWPTVHDDDWCWRWPAEILEAAK